MHLSRRKFLKSSAMAACATLASPLSVGAGSKNSQFKRPSISIAGYRLDRVQAMIDGRVQVKDCDARFVVDSIGAMNTNIFAGPHEHEVSEVGLHPFMLAYANEGFRKYSLIPVFPLRTFRHKSIFVRANGDIKKPEDLRGKIVSTPGFSSTSLTWLRGIIQHEYGVRPDEIKWVVSSKDSSAGIAGKVSKQEDIRPDGLSISTGPEGKDESSLLLDGDVDALFHAAEPRAYVEGDDRIVRLFPDYREVERDYFARTGIFPIMHAVAIRNDVIDQYPWLPEAVFNAYSKAKQIMYDDLKNTGWATISLPWIGKELEETRALLGNNYWPYGIKANRKTLETLFQYSYEQRLAKRIIKIEDLFHPSTIELMDV